jgi:hypothetical protein
MATNPRKDSTSLRKKGAAMPIPQTATGAKPQPAGERAVSSDGPAQSTDLERRIAERAYEIYLQRGGAGGDAMSDWLQAEAEIRGSQRAMDENKARMARPPEKGKKGKALDKEVQQFYGTSAGGI